MLVAMIPKGEKFSLFAIETGLSPKSLADWPELASALEAGQWGKAWALAEAGNSGREAQSKKALAALRRYAAERYAEIARYAEYDPNGAVLDLRALARRQP